MYKRYREVYGDVRYGIGLCMGSKRVIRYFETMRLCSYCVGRSDWEVYFRDVDGGWWDRDFISGESKRS
uniref:hypothetical protein n=1 Tax=Paenibacillus xylanexedens TaxID=528191 RepID=UPI001C92F284